MHSIERYGIVALLFLVVTVVAVLMWDGGKEKGEKKPGAGLTAAAPAVQEPAPSQPPDAGRRLSLAVDSQPGPLQRRARANERAGLPAGAEALASPLASPLDQGSTSLPAEAGRSPAPLLEAPPAPEEQRQPVREPVVGAAPAASHAYTVAAGDTLSEIAQRELGSSRRWREIVAANPGLDPARLRLGSQIQIPGAKAGAPSATLAAASSAGSKKPVPASAPKPAAGGKTWKVGPGESLWRIAEKALGDGKRWREIAALNPRVNPDRLGAGTVLVLPASAATKSAPSRSSPAPKRESAPTVVASRGSDRPARAGGRVR